MKSIQHYLILLIFNNKQRKYKMTEINIDAFLDDFEATGAQLSAPHLDEGKYRGTLVDFQIRFGTSVHKKGEFAGQTRPWNMWNARYEVNSVKAQQKMKRDNAPIVYTDRQTEGYGNGSLQLCEIGISKDNAHFWGVVGKFLQQVGLAEVFTDDAGVKSFKIDRSVTSAMYRNTKSLLEELQNKPDLDALLVPALLAEDQLKNLSEFLAAEQQTKQVYLHIQVRNNSQDSSKKEHFVKGVFLPSEFEAVAENMAALQE